MPYEDATITLYTQRWVDRLTLDEVAAHAGVTVQTVIRRFGSIEGLLAAAENQLEQRVAGQRFKALAGNITAVVRNLFDHFETVGDLVLRSLAQEGQHESVTV